MDITIIVPVFPCSTETPGIAEKNVFTFVSQTLWYDAGSSRDVHKPVAVCTVTGG